MGQKKKIDWSLVIIFLIICLIASSMWYIEHLGVNAKQEACKDKGFDLYTKINLNQVCLSYDGTANLVKFICHGFWSKDCTAIPLKLGTFLTEEIK